MRGPSSDAVNGATGIALAGYLEMPHVAVIKQLDYDPASSTATVKRELEAGWWRCSASARRRC